MPKTLSGTRHPVGLLLQPGRSWTVARWEWTYVWAVEPEPEAGRRGPPASRDRT